MSTRLVFLGTGTPNPDPRHQGPSLAVVVNGESYLVDCGPGLVRQAAATGMPELSMAKLNKLFVTHLHSDHTIGYPDLMFTPAVTGRLTPLEVWGPPGMARLSDHVLEAWTEDRGTRLNGGEPSVPSAYEVQVTEFVEGMVYDDSNVQVSAFAVQHGKWRHAYGFRFETADRTIVISGDTTYCPNLIKHARGCDVLVHEAYSAAGLVKRTSEWQAYHSTYHTSGPDVGKIAAEIEPGLLLLYHLLPFGMPPGQIADEVRSIWNGQVIEAEDLAVY